MVGSLINAPCPALRLLQVAAAELIEQAKRPDDLCMLCLTPEAPDNPGQACRKCKRFRHLVCFLPLAVDTHVDQWKCEICQVRNA